MFTFLRTREGKKFSVIVCIIFAIAVSVISRAAFKGVEAQYNLPMHDWDLSLYIIQGAWVGIYSIMFTILGSLPFGFYLLSPRN